jgi:hypothetical protein
MHDVYTIACLNLYIYVMHEGTFVGDICAHEAASVRLSVRARVRVVDPMTHDNTGLMCPIRDGMFLN